MDKAEKQLVTYFRLSEQERSSACFGGSAAELLRKGSFAVGYAHVVMLNDNGTVTARGSNNHGQCDVKNWKSIVKVAAGDYHTVGLKKDGTVVAVGDNSDGQCDVSAWKNIRQLYAEKCLTVGVTADGRLMLSEKSTNPAAPPTPAYEFLYHVSPVDDGIVIDKYKGNRLTVRIPSLINGTPVTEIGSKAFFKNTVLNDVSIPDSVRILGAKCFGDCPSLNTVHVSAQTKNRLAASWRKAFDGELYGNRYNSISFVKL